jgi:hypothetical protein
LIDTHRALVQTLINFRKNQPLVLVVWRRFTHLKWPLLPQLPTYYTIYDFPMLFSSHGGFNFSWKYEIFLFLALRFYVPRTNKHSRALATIFYSRFSAICFNVPFTHSRVFRCFMHSKSIIRLLFTEKSLLVFSFSTNNFEIDVFGANPIMYFNLKVEEKTKKIKKRVLHRWLI